MNPWKQWGAFIFLGVLAWGTSFLWIKIALEEIGPFTLVTYRVGFGCAASWLLVWLLKIPLKHTRPQFWIMLAMGLVNTALPFTLISWAETRIDSGLAGVLNGSMPLFTMLIAHWTLPDDRITTAKLTGLMAGFAGLVILLSRDVSLEGLSHGIWGQLAMLGAAIAYAASTVVIRAHLRNLHPLHVAAVSLTFAVIIMSATAAVVEAPFTIPRLGITWLACAWMGILGVGLAYLAYFHLIRTWGATRTSLVTYAFSITAVTLGVLFLGERPSWRVFVGGALIIGGIALVNARKHQTS
ncbi:MAG: DMT family transporter [Calditrichota bacterium]